MSLQDQFASADATQWAALWLIDAIDAQARLDQIDARFETFADAGVMTRDQGVVLRIGDREFQITVVQSK